jgi:hypothetical protein
MLLFNNHSRGTFKNEGVYTLLRQEENPFFNSGVKITPANQKICAWGANVEYMSGNEELPVAIVMPGNNVDVLKSVNSKKLADILQSFDYRVVRTNFSDLADPKHPYPAKTLETQARDINAVMQGFEQGTKFMLVPNSMSIDAAFGAMRINPNIVTTMPISPFPDVYSAVIAPRVNDLDESNLAAKFARQDLVQQGFFPYPHTNPPMIITARMLESAQRVNTVKIDINDYASKAMIITIRSRNDKVPHSYGLNGYVSDWVQKVEKSGLPTFDCVVEGDSHDFTPELEDAITKQVESAHRFHLVP